jgi:hypothetical protein
MEHQLLRGYFKIESRDDPQKIREKVTGKVLTLAPALGPVVPALLALRDVPADEAAWHALDPLQRRQQTLDALALTRRLGLGEARATPSTSPLTSRRQAAPRMLKATTARRWPSPSRAACARSSPTATSASACSIAQPPSRSPPSIT